VEMVVIKLVVMVERHNGERWKRETMVEKEKIEVGELIFY